jgi:hypothetical protein
MPKILHVLSVDELDINGPQSLSMGHSMTAIAEPVSPISVVRQPRFYFYTSLACAAVAFLGFAPTYWAPLVAGSFKGHPIVHIHALIFFSWTLFFVFQTWLAASGRVGRHRMIGMAGISLATAMTILGIMAAVVQMRNAASLGLADAGKAFAIVPLGGIFFFAVTFALAIANIRRSEWHKRWMLLAMISILDAPIARWVLTFLAPSGASGPPPVSADILPAFLACGLIVVAIVHDWRMQRSAPPVYAWGGGALLVLKLAQVPISATALWNYAASWLLALAR